MKHQNRPPHIYLDDTFYFITARTLKKVHLFNTNQKKQILLDVIKQAVNKYDCKFLAWIILDNHYHLLLKLLVGETLSGFVGNIHTNSSRLLNQADNYIGRKVWWNYWDHCIRDEGDYYRHLNYIHQNPIKHGYVQKMEDYYFSSYKQYLSKYGTEWLHNCFEQYPIISFVTEDKI